MKPMIALFRVLMVLLLLGSSAGAYAQYNSLGYFRQAELLFAQQRYHEAEQYYEQFLKTDKGGRSHGQPLAMQKKKRGESDVDPKQAATYHLAECYRRENDYVRAETWYAKSCAFKGNAYPERRFWYGVALRANGKYQQAIEELTAFEKAYNDMGPVLIDADRELASLRFIQAQLALGDQRGFRLQRQSSQGNTSAYALAVKQGDTLVFTGIHAEGGARTIYKNGLYAVVQRGGSIVDSNLLAGAGPYVLPDVEKVEDSVHTGLACFSTDGRKMYCTRWSKTGGKTRAAIWFSKLTDSGWLPLVRMDDPVNLAGYNSTQPFLTTDGHYLLYSSDRPGGIGKYDLWYATLDTAGEVVAVNNVGAPINTAGDEESPYYHTSSRMLVFASNGRPGMGGFDLYYSMGNFDLSRWTEVVNPGIPVNSSRDDLYYISTDEDNCWNTGFLSSDRDGGCCLALYSVQENSEQVVAGRIVDAGTGKPLPAARVELNDPHHGGRRLAGGATDSLGRYLFVLKNTSRFELAASKPDYLPGGDNIVVHITTGRDSVPVHDLALNRVPPAQPVVVHSSILGNFPYKKSLLPVAARMTLDSVVSVLKAHPEDMIRIEGYTDGIGGDEYNLRLAQQRVDVCVRYLLKQGIGKDQIVGVARGRCCPLAPDTIDGKDNPAGREVNRRVEYHIIQRVR